MPTSPSASFKGFLQIHEESVTLHVRPSDERAVGRAATSAAQAYKAISGRDVQFTVQCTLPRDRYGQYLYLGRACSQDAV